MPIPAAALQQPPSTGDRRVGVPVWLVLIALLLLTAAVRMRVLGVPLERDEGEYAYGAQLMLQGVPPYEQLYTLKPPGASAVYAAFLVLFGETARSIHFGLLLVNAASLLLVFRLTWLWQGSLAGLVAAACFALLSAGRATQGLFANAEHFVVLCALAGWVLLPQALASGRWRRLAWAGGFLGLGIVMKQHGALFAAGALAYALLAGGWRPSRQVRIGARHAGWIAVGIAIPLASTAGALAIAGSFDRFWFWTVTYARRYATDVTAHDAVELFKLGAGDAVGSMPLIWILAGLGVAALAWNRNLRDARTFVGFFVVSAVLAVCPGLFFRAHYFLLVLPAVALLAGLGVGSLVDLPIESIRKPHRAGIAVAVAILCWAGSFAQNRAYLLEMSPTAVSRATFGLNAFPESIAIADYIRSRTVDGDRIAILGSEPQIYFHAGRRSATPYVYTYEMMRPHAGAAGMQKEMARDIEKASPKFLLFVRIEDSWSRENESPNFVFDWFESYARDRYDRVGLVTITPEQTQYYWAPDVPWPPDTHYWVLILRRKD